MADLPCAGFQAHITLNHLCIINTAGISDYHNHTTCVCVCVSVFVYLSIGKWENMNERKMRAGQRYISLHVVFICEVRWTSEQSRIHETCMRLGNCPHGNFLPLGTINSSESLSIVKYLKYERYIHLRNDHTLHFDNTAKDLVFFLFVFCFLTWLLPLNQEYWHTVVRSLDNQHL